MSDHPSLFRQSDGDGYDTEAVIWMFVWSYHLKSVIKTMLSHAIEAVDFARYHPSSGLRKRAHESSLNFIEETARKAIAFASPKDLMRYALRTAQADLGAFAEFGVYRGKSINFIAKQVSPATVFGFDSFEGLPVHWHNMERSSFSLGGRPPKVRDNVRLIKGLYDESLPGFLGDFRGNFAFMHIDCDVYVSVKAVLDNAGSRIVPGTVILFDDYFNQPFWEDDSHKAFSEFIERTRCKVTYLGFGHRELLVRIDAIDRAADPVAL